MIWQTHVFTFNPFSENTYVIWKADGHGWIIDPGCSNKAEYEALSNYLLTRKIIPKGVLLTHAHIDHILGCHFFTQRHGLPVYVHREDLYNIDMAERVSMMYGIPFTPFGEAILYDDKETGLPDSDDSIKKLLCPGHSKGSVCFYSAEDSFVIAGDVLFNESIGRSDLPGGNLGDLEKSIRTKLYALPDDVRVYPGHGPSTSIGHEKKYNLFVKEF